MAAAAALTGQLHSFLSSRKDTFIGLYLRHMSCAMKSLADGATLTCAIMRDNIVARRSEIDQQMQCLLMLTRVGNRLIAKIPVSEQLLSTSQAPSQHAALFRTLLRDSERLSCTVQTLESIAADTSDRDWSDQVSERMAMLDQCAGTRRRIARIEEDGMKIFVDASRVSHATRACACAH